MTSVEIRPTRFGAPVAQKMVVAAQEEITQRYGSGDAGHIESIQFDPPEGIFLVAYLAGEPVGCAGWRTVAHFSELDGVAKDAAVEDDIAEVKRMFVSATARNNGVATALMAALEDSARANGKRRMILETGLLQPEAIALYQKLGYQQITNYGYYRDQADCVSFGRDL